MKPWQAKMIFGLLLLLAIFVLAVLVARQSAALQEISNTDLQQVLTVLAVLAGGFAQWAFRSAKSDDEDDDQFHK